MQIRVREWRGGLGVKAKLLAEETTDEHRFLKLYGSHDLTKLQERGRYASACGDNKYYDAKILDGAIHAY